jgi:hypothetical protein
MRRGSVPVDSQKAPTRRYILAYTTPIPVVYACEGANRQPEAPPSAIASTFSSDIA